MTLHQSKHGKKSDRLKMAPIIFTEDRCKINGRSEPHLPLLRDHQYRVVPVLNDYVRYLRVVRNHPTTTTIRQYASVLRDFWNFLLDQKVVWTDVDDGVLIGWRNLQSKNGLLKQTINYNLTIVLQFYWWAQTQGHTGQQIGYGPQPDGSFVDFLISIKPAKSGKYHAGFTSDIKFKTSVRPKTYNPTNEEVREVKEDLWAQSENPQVTTRNVLIVTWASHAGLRRKEILSLSVEQIPSSAQINELLENEQTYSLTLYKTKGEKVRTVPVHPAVLQQTREYIDNERRSLVARFNGKKGYQRPPQVFLSEKTGLRLTEKAATNILTRSAKNRKTQLSLHPLRGKYLTNLVAHLMDTEIEKHGQLFDTSVVLLKAMEIAGHNHASTLERYLKLEQRKRLGSDVSSQTRFKEEYLELLDQQIESRKRQIKKDVIE